MQPYFMERFGNATSIHQPGQRARGGIESARQSVAKLLGDPDVRVRQGAINFLEFFPEARPAVVSDLTRALSDPDAFVRVVLGWLPAIG